MKKLFTVVYLLLILFFTGCIKNPSEIDYNLKSTNLRIINMTQHAQTFYIKINNEFSIDTLQCNRSSGYLKTKSDSVHIEFFDRYNNTLLYDSSMVLENNNFYTLIMFESANVISSILVNDSVSVKNESTAIRIFNNSETGEPFSFFMKSTTDTVSFVSPQLYNISNYMQLSDTLYTPAIQLISSGNSVDYQSIAINRSNHYTFIITDTFSKLHAYYPYICYVFIDLFDTQEIQRL